MLSDCRPLSKMSAVRFDQETFQKLETIVPKGELSKLIRLLVNQHLAATEAFTDTQDRK